MLLYEHWAGSARTEPDEKTSDTSERQGLLDAVIERSGKPRRRRQFRPTYLVFPTSAYESRFKSCLSRVPLECRTQRLGRHRVIALRPKNVDDFRELIRTSGLANCEAANRAVEWLRENPDEFLLFDH